MCAWNSPAIARSGLTDDEVTAMAYLDDALFMSKDIANREPGYWLLERFKEMRLWSQTEALRHAEIAWNL